MTEHIVSSTVAVISAIIGVAIIAVLVSNRAQTGSVITSAGQALANDISAATAPVTGMAATPNVGGGSSFGGFSLQGSPLSSFNY